MFLTGREASFSNSNSGKSRLDDNHLFQSVWAGELCVYFSIFFHVEGQNTRHVSILFNILFWELQ